MLSAQNVNAGFGLVEIIVITAVVTAAFASFLEAGILATRLMRTEKENLEATLLAQESLEAARSLRDESWSNNIASLSSGVSYYPVIENGKWKFDSAPPGPINGKYIRYVVFNDVYRDAQDRIAPSGTADPGTKKLTARVAWSGKQKELVTYLTDFQGSLSLPQENKVIFFEGADTDSDLGNFPAADSGSGDPAQSFLTPSAIQITKTELLLRRVTANPSNIYAEIRPSPTGAILGTSNIISSATISSTTPAWVELRFPDYISLNAATVYYIRLRSIPASTDAGSGSSGTIYWNYKQTPSSPYAGGEARRYIGRLSNPNDAGQVLDQYDFGFRVFALQ